MCIRWAAYQITRSHNHPQSTRRDTLLKLVRRQFVVSLCSTARTLSSHPVPTTSNRDEAVKTHRLRFERTITNSFPLQLFTNKSSFLKYQILNDTGLSAKFKIKFETEVTVISKCYKTVDWSNHTKRNERAISKSANTSVHRLHQTGISNEFKFCSLCA